MAVWTQFMLVFKDTPVEKLYENFHESVEHKPIWKCWTFNSVVELLQNVAQNKKYVDVATGFGEMGYYFVLAYIPETKLFFVRPYGGPSYVEQLTYSARYDVNYDPSKLKMRKLKDEIINVQLLYSELVDILEYDFINEAYELLRYDDVHTHLNDFP